MTKQSVVVPEPPMIAPAAVPTGASQLFPPPRSGGGCGANASGAKKKYMGHLEVGAGGGRINAWVDSMRASSPTHARAAAALATSPDATDEVDAWTRKHPSALNMFDEIVRASKGKQIAMFLDYDGTLSPIVDEPDKAYMSEAMRAAVKGVASYFPTAIVSGRCRDKVYNFVQLAELYYAGSHGMDIKGPTNNARKHNRANTKTKAMAKAQSVLFQPASEFLPMIDEVYKTLIEKTMAIEGSKVENNKFCISVHFRRVDEKKWSTLVEEVRSVMKDFPKLRLTMGRKVLEIRPTIKWDKGKALEFLLESLGFADCNDILPVYIGDDRTDEDAFKVLRDRGQGLGILVSEYPKETNASYSLREPKEVMQFLQRLVEWKSSSNALKARARVFPRSSTTVVKDER